MSLAADIIPADSTAELVDWDGDSWSYITDINIASTVYSFYKNECRGQKEYYTNYIVYRGIVNKRFDLYFYLDSNNNITSKYMKRR